MAVTTTQKVTPTKAPITHRDFADTVQDRVTYRKTGSQRCPGHGDEQRWKPTVQHAQVDVRQDDEDRDQRKPTHEEGDHGLCDVYDDARAACKVLEPGDSRPQNQGDHK